jgi:hypothetical protein
MFECSNLEISKIQYSNTSTLQHILFSSESIHPRISLTFSPGFLLFSLLMHDFRSGTSTSMRYALSRGIYDSPMQNAKILRDFALSERYRCANFSGNVSKKRNEISSRRQVRSSGSMREHFPIRSGNVVVSRLADDHLSLSLPRIREPILSRSVVKMSSSSSRVSVL